MQHRLAHFGEQSLIDRLSLKAPKSPDMLLGIGDDCSVTLLPDGSCQLVTMDTLVENIDFIRDLTPPEDLGYKSLAVSLSDIAAMGGRPESAFLSLSLPEELDLTWFDRFFSGFYELNVPLLGGDLSRTPLISITVCVLGRIDREHVKYRSGAKPGDTICVTGPLGDSAAGLRLILNHLDTEGSSLAEWHRRPRPALDEGVSLGREPLVHAMIDISDGLARDALHLAESSKVTIEVDLEALPLSSALQEASRRYKWDSLALAAGGGEDYQLLVAVDPLFLRTPPPFALHPIGRVKAGPARVKYLQNGIEVSAPASGFDHFS